MLLNEVAGSGAFVGLMLAFNLLGQAVAVATATLNRIPAVTVVSDVTPDKACDDTRSMADECFKDLPPHLIEFLQASKVVINEQEIIAKCTVFNRGMQCFDAYTARCLTEERISLYNNNVEGAKNFFQKFCSDREFQKTYLQHKDCLVHIQDDWEKCTNDFQNILTDEMLTADNSVSDKYLQFCCARHAYENCLYRSARFKCYSNSVEFARYAAKILSDEKHFTNCREYEDVCAADNGAGTAVASLHTVQYAAAVCFYIVVLAAN